MRIIKHGKNPEPKVILFECQKCGCVFEAEERECEVVSREQVFRRPVITGYYAKCPECGGRVETLA